MASFPTCRVSVETTGAVSNCQVRHNSQTKRKTWASSPRCVCGVQRAAQVRSRQAACSRYCRDRRRWRGACRRPNGDSSKSSHMQRSSQIMRSCMRLGRLYTRKTATKRARGSRPRPGLEGNRLVHQRGGCGCVVSTIEHCQVRSRGSEIRL
jgi:hypothetical protein